VLGTRPLMEGPVYASEFGAHGIAHRIPEQDERQLIDRRIFDELVYGKFTAETRQYFVGVVESLKERGCDAVVLGCTEIPLLVTGSDLPIPTLDSTRLLARAALRLSLEGER
jgi:aspartate racemase